MRRHGVEKIPHLLVQVDRRFQAHSADAEVARHHPLTGEILEDPQQLFAFAEAVEEHRQRADVERMGPEPHQVRLQPRQLVHQHAQPLGAFWNFKLQQLLDGQAVTEIVRHRRKIVDAIGQWDHLLVELRLARLLDAGMQVADIGSESNHGLAIDLQHEPQNAMRRRMLRPHVEAPWCGPW